ncbi:glycine cleavage system aminomethyltransferase GcvT [Pinisolibacter aquiterrae]|uniref:glycine cleavage system aminomethyltransferase GcvT n=1 Tax=Pinisolibacter aquiterrae TaxID=2815579 RepID=UPI001C3CFE38|nr:glycine cleavage system aminomethyltransferase GcvT [Pinisolibacter aquiterrae]MBV5266698.1 glycine cleavage system aminomethyltransferase GcvT [Pinisolibacter aquiterrae]MCC8234989.1 glycine cleavage system aminomethyltransferase GcvT [Pinisolibacter aquiterrae]
MTAADTPVLETPLAASHVGLGARMVPFAGYLMPVQYPTGILAEHQWTRAHAGLFDVSHMGQAALIGPDHATTAKALEALIPAAVVELGEGRQRYSQLLADDGGILDDLMFAREAGADGRILLVVNAACKTADYAHIAARLPEDVRLEIFEDRSLLALQGPEAEAVIESLGGEVSGLRFMDVASVVIAGVPVHLSRSGYTGEDGFEISVANDDVTRLWDLLLEDARVKPIGLGARDSLRLEGGLCLYGHDIDTTTSPIEGALSWSIQKRRRKEGGFPGWARIARELEEGPARIRVGLLIGGRQPAREGAEIATKDGTIVGRVTSGGYGPTVEGPIAMGYVPLTLSMPGTDLDLIVRGRALPARVVALPFVPAGFRR